jgi:hypothetical protein
MGLTVNIGHMGCLMPKAGPASFNVIHVNGIHRVRVSFCGCGNSIHPRQQLLRRGWYPATIHQPHTCATFIVLNHFHLQTLHSKLTATHFIAALERETDNTGLVPVKVCDALEFLVNRTCAYTLLGPLCQFPAYVAGMAPSNDA